MSKYKIFIGNLNFKTKKEALEKTFSQFGEVVDVSIPIYHDTKRPKGFAFVEFTATEAVDKALALTEPLVIEGREVTISSASPDKKNLKKSVDEVF